MISCVSSSTTCSLSHRRRTLPHSWRPPATLHSSYQLENYALRVHNLRSIFLSPVAAIPFDISPPPIDHDFLDDESIVGSKVPEDWGAESLNNDDEALRAVDSGSVVVDLSHYGRIRGFTFGYVGNDCTSLYTHHATKVLLSEEATPSSMLKFVKTITENMESNNFSNLGYYGAWTIARPSLMIVSGDDRLQFLHNQSTANFEVLREGEGCDTVFVTPTARTIDIAHAWIMKNAVTLVVSPLKSESISGMLTKYIFLADKVEIEDITGKTCLFVLVGPQSNQVIKNLGLGELIGKPYGSHKHYSVSVKPITVAVGNIISEEGFSLLMAPDAARLVWNSLVSLGTTPMSSNAWETYRILQGRPAPGKELTDEFNVLEAGLWNSISLNKGCYKGQETISRLVTYDGVKQSLWGIRLCSPAEPGSPITVDGKKVGKLTSYARNESEHFGLGYIKKRAATKGDTVTVGYNITGTVVDVPYLARQRPLSIKSKS